MSDKILQMMFLSIFLTETFLYFDKSALVQITKQGPSRSLYLRYPVHLRTLQ